MKACLKEEKESREMEGNERRRGGGKKKGEGEKHF